MWSTGSMPFKLVTFAIAGLAVASCAHGTDSPQTSIAAAEAPAPSSTCPTPDEPMGATGLFEYSSDWSEILDFSWEEQPGANYRRPVSPANARPPTLLPGTRSGVKNLGQKGLRVFVGSADVGDVRATVGLGSDGEFSVLSGSCVDPALTASLNRFATGRIEAGKASSSLEVLNQLIKDIGAARADLAAASTRTSATPKPWASLPASARSLDVEQTPPHVLAKLRLVDVTVAIPPAWYGARAHVCTRIELGWNECVPLRADQAERHMMGYAEPSKPLQIWLLDPSASFAGLSRHVGDISAAQWSDGAVKLLGDPSIDRSGIERLLSEAAEASSTEIFISKA